MTPKCVLEYAWERPDACKDQVLACHDAASIGDPKNLGGNATVNRICENAETFCYSYIMDGYRKATDRGYFDIGTISGSPPEFHRLSSTSLTYNKPSEYL